MAITQTVQWIALPNGSSGDRAARKLRLSVFVSPRLRAADVKHPVLDWFEFRDWPVHVGPGALTFRVEIENGPQIPAVVTSGAPEPDLWTALFAPDTPVESYTFDDFADRPIITYSLLTVLDYLKERYARVAAQSTSDLPYIVPQPSDLDAPSLVDDTLFREIVDLHHQGGLMEGLPDDVKLGQRIGDLLTSARQTAAARRANPPNPDPGAILVTAGGADPAGQFAQTVLFHRRLAGMDPVDLPETEAETKRHYRERIDFHQMLSALSDYPELMRRLGLVFDLEIPAAALPETSSTEQVSKLRVLPVERSGDQCPWTVYTNTAAAADAPMFCAAPRESGALLDLSQPGFVLTQVDVDGAAIKVINMSATLGHQESNPDRPIEEPDRAGVPTLRTGGIALVRDGHAEKLRGKFLEARNTNQQIEAGQAPTLFADDVTRGYRIDVFDTTAGRWRSLHERVGTYNVLKLGNGPIEIHNEGFTQLGVVGAATGKDASPDPNGEMYIHESLLTWDGWSLSAPRPGLSISRSARAPTPHDPETQPSRVPNQAMTAMGLEVTFRTQPGSLPRLRFQREYRLRVRTVDLAGNSVTVEEATQLMAQAPDKQMSLPNTGALAYSRFEPVSAPVLVPRIEYTEGEALERLVVRSNFDKSAKDYAAAHTELKYRPESERHVAAPKTSLQAVETHGMLDAALDARGQGLPPDQTQAAIEDAYEIARREKGSLNDPSPMVRIISTSNDPTDVQGYAIHTEEHLELPYLPDPLAQGAVFTGLPGTAPGSQFEISYDGPTWYRAQPFRLRLIEGDGAPEWDEASRVMTVRLAKSKMATVRLSSTIRTGAFASMGLLVWCEEAVRNNKLSPADWDGIVEAAKENRHWMLTPWRDVTLVHAVQQPLQAPQLEFTGIGNGTPRTVSRDLNDTRAYLSADVNLHMPSTSRLDVEAAWREPRDDLRNGDPLYGDDMLQMKAHVLGIAIPPTGREPLLEKQEFGRALAFHDEKVVSFDANTNRELLGSLRQQLMDATLQSRDRDAVRRCLELLEQVRPHEFGDTKYRRVQYRAIVASRFRDYFPAETTSDPENISRASETVVLDVLSSAPPGAPKVLYALPTFRWEAQGALVDGRTSIRRGGGVRLYLDGPWFSSGEGELLGVVLPGNVTGASFISPDQPDYPYVTLWGQDPVWSASGLASPGLASFKNVLQVGERLQLLEMQPRPVWVAAFPVEFDSDRKLWYCDIEIDTEQAYFPFVRLALARYQPHSIPGAHLSQVLLADVVQTVPDRILTVKQHPIQAGTFTVQVSGPAYSAIRQLADDEMMQASSHVEARLVVRNADISDETLGWEPGPDVPVTLAAVPTAGNGTAAWSGQITVPAVLKGKRVRLLVEENEQLFTEDLKNPQGGFTLDGRLVYADVVELQ